MNTQALKTFDLRIGNFLYIPGLDRIVIVSAIYKSHFRCEDMNGISFEESVRVNYTPIPLTEEWHNKFGSFKDDFKSFRYPLPRKNNINVVVIFQGDYVMLVQDEDAGYDKDVVSIWNRDLTKRDMYVHEWQNLFWCLTGEELEIKI